MGKKKPKEMRMNISTDKWTILLIAIISFWVSSNLNWGRHKPQTIIKADGKGYYAHLPALFIYGDMNFGFFDEYEGGKYYNKHLYYNYLKEYEGKKYNKYFCGTAVPMVPFFLMAHALARITGKSADGYSDLYHIFINIAAIAYLVLALVFFGKLLDRFKISAINKSITYLIIYFGTNWFYWVNLEPAVSHVYSVALIPLFYYYYLKFSDFNNRKDLVIASLVLGLIILIRPINVICILALPVFYDSFQSFWLLVKKIFTIPINLLCAVIFSLSVVSIQLILYKVQLGQFWVYSYEDEGFNFLNPEILNFLFSYKKGLFVYTPVLLLSLFGYYYWYKFNKWSAVANALFLSFLIYILSSWHMWWYGGGFGTRVMIDYYILLALPIAFLFQNIKPVPRKILVVMFTVLVLFTQFQTCQYRYYLLHWDGPTQAEYWNVFLKPWF
jgi:hypothetical protein